MEHKEDELVFFVNGKKVSVASPDPERTLLSFLRDKLRLTGTKLVCGEGGCGACTVMVSKYRPDLKRVVHLSVNACLMPLCAAHGLAITTVEGIGSSKTRLHPVQERLAKSHGSQCGFCTPGIVMSMYTLLRNKPLPDMQDIETYMQGNLCRCTGYRAILDGFKTLTSEFKGCGAKNCCQLNGQENGCGDASSGMPENGVYLEEERVGTDLVDSHKFSPYDPTQEAIFPPELMLQPEWATQSMRFVGPRVTWYRPASLQELLDLKATHPEAKLVNGNTEVGVEVKFKHCEYPVIINPSQVQELTSVTWDQAGVTFGAASTLSDIEQELHTAISQHPDWKTRVFSAITEMLRWFAGTQIRNVSAIGGNIMTGSPISDLVPLLMSADSQLTLVTSSGKRRTVPIRGFYTSYRRNVAQPDEVLLSVTVPFTAENEFFMGYKQAHRRDDDIAIVNAGIFVRMRGETVETFRATYGGMAPTAASATKTEQALIGRTWDESLLNSAIDLLLEDLPLDASAPGGMVEYRRTLTISFFFKFFLQTTAWLTGKLDKENASVLETFHRPAPASSQLFQVVPKNQPVHDLVGRPVTHVSALKQVTGEAQYCDDIPSLEDELHAGLVLSCRAHARIISVDADKALREPGATHFISAKDLEPEKNRTGPAFLDEEVFRAEKVTSMGQIIGIVLACDRATAQRAARKVKVTYEELHPIITIEDALREESFFAPQQQYEHGDVDAAITASPHVVEGSVRMGGQEHFYLEPVGCIAVPKEDNEMEVFASTQCPAGTQMNIARALGVPANRIVCKAKRLGGGFGGKESRTFCLSTAVAVAANRSGRPVRAILERDEDMASTGTRHPFLGRYRAGVTRQGKVNGVEMWLFANGGYSADLSVGVISRATTSCDNAYCLPTFRIDGKICFTNTPSNTAFRGFGGPQGCFLAETMMDDIANQLHLDPIEVRRLNMYHEAELSITRQPVLHVTLERCLDECIRRSEYQQAKEEVEKFNSSNRWKKRGLAVIPNKYGIAFGLEFLNQGGALVHIYRDGSVLVTIGGVEIGQGLYTKCYQTVTRALGVPVESVYISETSTDKVPNAVPTAASMSTDLYCAAVLDACEQLRQRLAPFRQASPQAAFQHWVNAAYMQRVSLSACGFEKTRGLTYNPESKTGAMFAYYVYGAACSVVEIDCLTGDHQVLRADIVMDIGESLNPAIDIGQIEGAFMQGYGLFCMERLKYSPKGFNYTRGPGAYKIPGFGDIPLQLNVSLLRGTSNPRAVYSSKAVGEPPLFCAASVFFAIKEAIRAARRQQGVEKPFDLHSPATPDRIRMACQDTLTDKLPPSPAPGSFVPWMVDL
ncbi:xanthine dehydrogenase/oxidase-like [Pollicipes pollicipes]|uniref:xanthine dehydrogenase/oxidase-like n=1 Tax=Pollicipes pollicipes TaxID=41117 RepID=UPI00188549C1|nr:xanthine dehydrogenase/oxidase-like [Pollicipes pollicipes]